MQQVLSGLASLQGLPERISAQNVLLLTYGGGARNPGILRLIESWRCNLLHFPFSTALLEGDQVSEVFEVFEGLRFRPDVLVSVGGGAVLDLAKCLKLLFDCPSTVLLSHEERNWQKNTLHVAVPTTAGTGSEATPFATVYQGETKHSVEDPRLIPALVVLDPSLLADLPRETAVFCGFDALAQALESVWSLQATEESLGYAFEAIEGILMSFRASIFEPSSASVAKMQSAAYLAGKAIAISRTTLAHALSYLLSARFHLPHGLAVFLNLPKVIRFNAGMKPEDCIDPRGIENYREKMKRIFLLFGVEDHEGLALFLESFCREMGVSPDLREHGIREDQIFWMVESAVAASRAGNNPRRMDGEGLRHALR